MQEHEAWNTLIACQDQLRLAPSGHVIGIDMNAALRLAAARGHDLAVLSELLPAAEVGLVEAFCAGRDRLDQVVGTINALKPGRADVMATGTGSAG